MARRHRISKESLLSEYGSVILVVDDHDRNRLDGRSSLHRIGDGVNFYAMVSENREPLIISASIENLVACGYVDEVLVQYGVGHYGSDSVAFKWTLDKDNDEWNGTYTEEL